MAERELEQLDGLYAAGKHIAGVSLSLGLSSGLWLLLLLYTVGVLFHREWFSASESAILEVWCPSIILYNITSVAYNNTLT